MQKLKTIKRGLRWSPKPMKEYLALWNLGPGVALIHAAFVADPGAWNLFWVSAANCETHPLSEGQVKFLLRAALETAAASVGGQKVGDLALALMPADFTAHLRAHPDDTAKLTLAATLAPHWLHVIEDRGELFYEARKSEQGLAVGLPNSQGETIHDESSNIVAFFNFKGRRAR